MARRTFSTLDTFTWWGGASDLVPLLDKPLLLVLAVSHPLARQR